MKSKRVCQGYDPVFQAQGPHSIHPAPSTSTNNSHANHTPTTTSSSSTINNQSRRFTTAGTPISPPVSAHNQGLVNSSPREPTDYPYPRPPEQLLPHLNQPYHMDGPSHTGLSYPPTGRRTYNFDIKSLVSSH